MLLWLPIATLLSGTQPTGDPPGGPSSVAAAPVVETLVVDIRGVDDEVLRSSLSLRLGETEVRPRSGSVALEERDVYVRVRQSPYSPHRFEVSLITADGRAYDRTVDVERVDAPRALALSIVTLLTAIEQDAVAPDRQDVEVPTDETVERPEVEPAATPTWDIDERPPPAPVRPPPIEVGVAGAALAGATLGSPPGGTRGLAGGQLTIDLKLPLGATVAFDVRGLGWRSGAYGVQRIRVGAGAGYTWRKGAFELGALGLLTVEPWRVTQLETNEPLVNADGTRARSSPLLGLALRASPGYRLVRERWSMRVGPVVELTASASYDGRWGIPSVSSRDPQRVLFRPGGAEAFGGIEATFWIPVGR